MFKKTYFLLAPQLKLVKIGCSEHPLARMMSLRTMNAAETEPLFITETPEHELHEEFADYRDHGEWFKVSWVMFTFFKMLGENEVATRLATVLENRDGE